MTTRTPLFERLTPWIFVALWSTGFVVARYSTNNAGPLSFLTVRMLCAAVLLYVIAKIVKAPKLARGSWSTSAIVGTCMHVPTIAEVLHEPLASFGAFTILAITYNSAAAHNMRTVRNESGPALFVL